MSQTISVSADQPRLLSPFNIIAGLILAVGGGVAVYRFTQGLGPATNLTHTNPWGLWIGFDVMTGVALAAGGYVTSSAVYLFGMKEYKPIVRPAILTGFLGYSLVVVGLLFDLGRPWRLPYAFIFQAGPTSAMFEVALCVALYLTTLFVEFTPAAFEWLGWKWWRSLVTRLTLALTILGVILSTMHQSTLGGLFLIAPTKLHPLWYTPHIPVHFFVSSVVAGVSMVIFEGALSHRFFGHLAEVSHEQFDRITIGLAKAGSVALAIYCALKLVSVVMDNEWAYLATPMGLWWLLEVVGFAVVPCFLFAVGYRERRVRLIRVTAAIAVLGIIFNRLNVSMFAFNWQLPWEQRYFPSWMEIWVTLSLVVAGVVAFRWIVNRMPILSSHPDFPDDH